jgi:RNA polymerase sigma factor (sigma-70 family)
MSPTGESTAPFDSDEHYQRLRLKLILYFERRRCACPEDLADDCLHRVFLDVKEHGQPTSLDKFCFGFASKIFLESLRGSSRFTSATPDMPDQTTSSRTAERSRDLAKLSIGQLHPADRELMEQYYLDRRTAESLAEEWGLSPEGVRSRIFRKRRKLVRFFLANDESGRETKWPTRNIKK